MMHQRNSRSANRERVRVVVAMSGGVDSSVAAALLVDQGYEVVGIMMRLWSEPGKGGSGVANRCCTPDQMASARQIARHLDIPFYVLDLQQHFRQTIVQFFIDEHALGRTPNPCIECNRQIRFTTLFQRAMSMEAQFLATGHYARITRHHEGYRLLKAIDKTKDQSYVLHVLSQHHLAHTVLPVGTYTKSEVRDLARKFDLPVSDRQDSQDLCFVGDGDYRRFLREHDASAARAGPILDLAGQELGKHRGLSFYTIGQRKGLGLSSREPLYVLSKDPVENTLIVGAREDLGRGGLQARDVNWISGKKPGEVFPAGVKIRYAANSIAALVTPLEQDRAHVRFEEPALGVTPGQGVVFYDGDICLGGGIIEDEPANQQFTGAESRKVVKA
jgi:tRNA-specific 2-thiouridylase